MMGRFGSVLVRVLLWLAIWAILPLAAFLLWPMALAGVVQLEAESAREAKRLEDFDRFISGDMISLK